MDTTNMTRAAVEAADAFAARGCHCASFTPGHPSTLHTGSHRTGTKDTLGVDILVGDTIRVTAWGAPIRLADTGRAAKVIGRSRTGLILLDDPYIANGRAVSPGCLAVARRDGAQGHEGNR